MIYSEYDMEQQYNDFLDEVYPDCTIGGYKYSTSNALKDVDPVAYHEGFLNYIDSLLGESLWETVDGDYTDEEPCAHDECDHGICLDCEDDANGDPVALSKSNNE